MYDIHCTILGWLDWNTLNYYCIWDLQFVGYDIMPIACQRWICAGSDTRFVGAVLRISLSFLSGLRPGGAWYIAGGLDKRQKRDLRGKKFRQMTCRVMKRFGRTEQCLTSCIFIFFVFPRLLFETVCCLEPPKLLTVAWPQNQWIVILWIKQNTVKRVLIWTFHTVESIVDLYAYLCPGKICLWWHKNTCCIELNPTRNTCCVRQQWVED